MKDVLNFIGEHPWITFFIVASIGETIVNSVTAISRAVAKNKNKP